MPCNEAWSALKQHPNIAFAGLSSHSSSTPTLDRTDPLLLADLAMLADVVAKRTTCGGPVPTPPPVLPAPTHLLDNSFDSTRQLVPQATLQCSIDAGTRKRLTVERGAVNEALEMLDKAVARGGPLKQ